MASSRNHRVRGRGEKRAIPCVLAIGGLDPGGGAGLLADARAIHHAGAFACAAAAVLTVQSTSGLRSVVSVPTSQLIAQCTEVLAHQRVRAIKIGALGSPENVRAIARLIAKHPEIPAVVDPVMRPSRGRGRLLDAKALDALRRDLLPKAALVTLNAPEAAAVTGRAVVDLESARIAALDLVEAGARAVLVKGGHLTTRAAVDVLAFRKGEDICSVEFRAPRLDLPAFHGGGCVFASFIAGRLAGDANALLAAIRWAKRKHHAALARLVDVGGPALVLLP